MLLFPAIGSAAKHTVVMLSSPAPLPVHHTVAPVLLALPAVNSHFTISSPPSFPRFLMLPLPTLPPSTLRYFVDQQYKGSAPSTAATPNTPLMLLGGLIPDPNAGLSIPTASDTAAVFSGEQREQHNT